jgi:thioredoxin
MRKGLLLIALTAFAVISCGAKNGNESAKAAEEQTNSKQSEAKKATKTIHLTKAEFLKRVINYEANSKEWKYLGDKPAIIDFYATWCGPCKRIAPILDELAAEYEGKIYIYKIDTDKERELSTDFGIQSIPTIFFVPKKGDPKVAQGAMSKEELKKIIDSFLLEKK